MPPPPSLNAEKRPNGAAESWRLATADPSTAHVVRKDEMWYDLLFSRLWLEDAAGTRVLGTGQEVDVTREDWELMVAGSGGTSIAPS